jgi:hypothetical protein
MTKLLIAYRVKPEHLDQHMKLLRTVHDELARAALPGVGWVSHCDSADATRFYDLVITDRPGRFSSLSSWAAFRSGLDSRCDEPPTMTELVTVASSER